MQEHIRRLGDRGRDGSQELVACSTWREPQLCLSEYYAIVTGASEALAVQALAEEMGWKMSVRVDTDSSAAIVWGNYDTSS